MNWTEKNRLGMALFVLSEAVFFLLLIFGWVYFRAGWNETPAGGALLPASSRVRSVTGALAPFRMGGFTAALLASSVTMWRAEVSARRNRKWKLRMWLLATIALGSTFVYGQATEYLHLLSLNITISLNTFGSTFFTMTGFHGMHVIAGLILLMALFGIAWSADPAERHSTAVDTIAIYWHFVDLVWVGIFTAVYLWTVL
jgi:heme/copper-type cytochrome/quinol oxidase subunit 3